MAPGGVGKRKRGDRTYSGDSRDDSLRPSPHRPESLSLGQRVQQFPQHNQSYGRGGYGDRGRGGRRGSRGGYPSGSHRSPIQSPNTSMAPPRQGNENANPASFPDEKKDTPAPSGSNQQTQSSQVSAPVPEEREEVSPPVLPTFNYEYLTESALEKWTEQGAAEILSRALEARDARDCVVLGNIFQELIRASVESRLIPEDCGSLIKQIAGDRESSDDEDNPHSDFLAPLFLDTLSIFVEAFTFSPQLRPLVEATGISVSHMRTELEHSLLEQLGLIRNTFFKVGIRQTTNLLYRQSNYNLLREETEGYSKLVTEFFTTSNNEPPTSEVVEETFEKVKGMIGAFDLDVGRVLDITLDVFAAVLVKQYRFFVKYLRASSWWPQDEFAKYSAAQKGLGPLPRWALPGFEGRSMTIEEKEESEALRMQRDVAFWQRCKEIGSGAFFELVYPRADETVVSNALKQYELLDPKTKEDASKQNDEEKWFSWVSTTHTLPPVGNKIAAQVLGFKLRFYSSPVRDTSDVFPVNLIYLAALLIKIGFISLHDLYPHIWPADSEMEKVKEDKMKEKAEKEKLTRPGGGTNALLAAAPLPDDTVDAPLREATKLREAEALRRQQKAEATSRSTPTVQTEEQQVLPEPAEQKVQLLKSLLSIGALPEALYILGRFPWLPDAFPDLPEYIHRILHHSLSQVYEAVRPLSDEIGLKEPQKTTDTEQAGVPKGQIKLTEMAPRRTLRWAQLDRDDISEGIDYRFYWDDWADMIPVCQNVDDVFTLCCTLLNYTGVKIGQDPTLLLKLARIGTASLASDKSESNLKRWIDLSKRLLVPALSLTKCNPGMVNEVWHLLQHFSESTRYNIYAEWNSGQTSRLPDIKSAFDQTKAETRDVLKRISKTTIRPMARALAKVACASPGVVFSVAISQLESYENIVDTFVECARYFTNLAYDVLTWSLMASLGGQGRNRLQSDGLLTSKWLASLALFSGKAIKRYKTINPRPIIQYVEFQLRQGNPTDLIILEDIIRSMAGITSDVNYSEAQVQAMGSGELMQAQTLQQLTDRRHESKETAQRLMKPLLESELAGQVLISLAQQRQTCVYQVDEPDAHTKLLGNVEDQIHRVLGQYLELLRTNTTVEVFNSLVPSVGQLINDFGIDPSVAFWIGRQSVTAAMDEYDAAHTKTASAPVPDGNGKIEVSLPAEASDKAKNETSIDIEKSELTPSVEKGDPTEELTETEVPTVDLSQDPDIEMKTESVNKENASSVQYSFPSQGDTVHACHPILRVIAERIQGELPSDMWEALNPAFYVTFWQLDLSDVLVNLNTYEDEIARLKEKVRVIKADRTDVSVAGTQKKQREIKAIEELVQNLAKEMKSQIHLKHGPRLKKEKNHWFSGSSGKYDERHIALIEHCFFPRLVMSPIDSQYTFKMIKWLHEKAAANFRTMGVYDQFFREKRLTSMIFLCSSKEAECLGRFIYDILNDLAKWHADEKTYNKWAHGQNKNLLGFSRKGRNAEGQEAELFLSFEDFRRLLLKWHRNLNGALKTCFASSEYMHIRNAINVLNSIHQHFPAINWMGSNQLVSVTELSKNETREDLKIAATSLIAALKKREKNWVMPQAFSLMDGNQAASRGQRGSSTKPSTPQPANEAAKSLNPKAPEFKPITDTTSNGESVSKPSPTKLDAEDGEIDDAQQAEAPGKQTPTPSNTSPNQPATALNQDSKKLSSSQAESGNALETRHTYAASTTAKVTDGTRSPANTTNHAGKPAPIPTRPEPLRAKPSPILNGHPDLPSKPNPPMRHTDGRVPSRPEDRSLPAQGREIRAGARGLDGAREHPADGAVLRGVAQESRGSRTSSDDGYSRSSRDSRVPIHEERNLRQPSNRQHAEADQGRRDLITGQRSRDPALAAPTNTVPHHPDRAVLIQGRSEYDRESQSRYPPERHSRGPSPVRGDARGPPYDRNRTPLDARRTHEDRPSHSSYDDPSAPTGPRSERAPMGPPATSSERFRESMRPSHHSQAPVEPHYGRLRQEAPSQRQSESYGRLNSVQDTSGGPILSNGNVQTAPRSGRNAVPTHTLSENQPARSPQNSALSTQGRQAPTGPALRSSPRNQPPQNQPSSIGPTSTSQDPETAGIHPDRLRAMQGAGPPLTTKPGPATRSTDRLPPSPASVQSPEAFRGTNDQTMNTLAARGPPTGPADRRGDKRFTGIQNVLQQQQPPQNAPPDRSSQGTSIRGRGAASAGRTTNVPSPSTSGPPTPSSSFPPHDAFASRANGPTMPMPNDDNARYSRGPRQGQAEPEQRSTRQRSRSAGRTRGSDYRSSFEADLPPPRDDPRDRYPNDTSSMNLRGSGSRQDRRGPPQLMERELRGGPVRRGGREELPPRQPDDQEWGREQRGGMGRYGDERDPRGAGGSLRKRGRIDDGMGDRSFDSKRPRR